MKLSSRVLAGSLASAGMVLSLVAPAITAQAARTSGVTGADGSTVEQTKSTDADGMEGAGQLGKGNLAIAYTSADNTKTGPAAAYSNASVDVVSGVLVLDQVPDFNFGTAASGSVKGLQDNSKGSQTTTEATENAAGTAAVDGNSEGNLQVIESRDTLSGFTVSAALGQFKDTDEKPVTTTDPFILNLKPANMTLNGEDYKNGKVNYQTDSANISSDATSDPDTAVTQPTAKAAPVMDVKAGQTGYEAGTYAAQLNSDKFVSLSVPSGIGKGTQAVKSMNATITWTLAAKPTTATPEAK